MFIPWSALTPDVGSQLRLREPSCIADIERRAAIGMQ